MKIIREYIGLDFGHWEIGLIVKRIKGNKEKNNLKSLVEEMDK